MNASNNNQPSLRQVYQNLMSGMTDEDCKALMQMPHSSWVRFLNQLLPVSSCQLRAQDCKSTVAGSERSTDTHVKGEGEIDSIFAETEAPLIQLPCLGFKDLQDWSDNIILKTASSLLATPYALLCACCNSKELPSTYPAIINQFRVSHHKKTLYVYIKALFAKDNTVTPICLALVTMVVTT
ncbi:hypothetical protein DSO57_1005608 [Entomophthora muscae]|uniref:Uncharacterized protein n=1 Tax=Entomophthora muscae TaxID=34485 RepID=A0ACC2RMN9_9FUNG|nr:hypothetical protein DSO57_1005608 [Entomophthora muscae]